MKKFALAAAALLAVTGTALAENPNFGSTDINEIAKATVDNTHTSSISNDGVAYQLLNSDTNAQSAADAATQLRQDRYGSH